MHKLCDLFNYHFFLNYIKFQLRLKFSLLTQPLKELLELIKALLEQSKVIICLNININTPQTNCTCPNGKLICHMGTVQLV